MSKGNGWAARYGARRRAIDRELLGALERQIAREEALVAIEGRILAGLEAELAALGEALAARERLAAVFGRPIA